MISDSEGPPPSVIEVSSEGTAEDEAAGSPPPPSPHTPEGSPPPRAHSSQAYSKWASLLDTTSSSEGSPARVHSPHTPKGSPPPRLPMTPWSRVRPRR